MAQSWTADPNSLNQLIGLLRESQSNPQHQSGVSEKLDQFGTLPDYSNYLVYILTQVSSEEIPTRSISGLLLKNHIRLLFQNTPSQQWPQLKSTLGYVQETILPALSFEEAMLRRTATQVVAMVMELVGPEGWPRGVEALTMLIESQNPNEAEGAFSTFAKLCEDIPRELEEAEIGGVQILNILIPKFLQATEHPSDQIRVHALNCLNQFVQSGSNILQDHIDTYVQALFKRASDQHATVRRFVCQALVYLLGARPDKLQPEMNNVVEYMLYSTQDQDEDVALEACEFWLQFAEDPQLAENLRPYLDKVAPVLLKGMVYSEIDILMLDVDEDDAAVPDRPEDIKPQFGSSSKQHKSERVDENGQVIEDNPASGGSKSIKAIEKEEEEEEENYDDDSDYDEDDESMGGEWNLRKCSAAALDVLALTFPEELLNILLPLLKDRLFSNDWLQRESGILALGAIAEGCISGVQPHLPTLVPFLINCLSDNKPLVRSISCWTLGRYSSWCVSNKSPEHQTQYFIPTMEGLLHMALDNNKRVQEAGCSAFATLEEEAGSSLSPYLEPVLKNLVFAFEKYQQKNLLILYDAIGTLADSVGNELNRQDYVQLLMPPLISKWQSISDEDQALIPLLECLSSVTIAIGEGFLPYSPPVFQRCVSIVNNTLMQIQKEMNLPDYEREAERTFVIVALDLLSGLTQGLASNVEELVRMSQPPLLPLLKMCITDTDASVRQSAYALLGDLAISVFPLLRSNLPEIMPELIRQIEPEPRIENISVCNNAAWCAGEIALQYGSSSSPNQNGNQNGNGQTEGEVELQKWVDPLIQRLVPVLMNQKTVKSLSENAAVTIGRLGLVSPNLVAPHLGIFIEKWCEALWDIKDNEEKDSAFRGMCEMIQVNPNGAAKGFVYFCNAVVRWSTPSARLNDQFIKILTGFRDMSGDQWEVQKQQFPPLIVQRLAERYGL